MVILVIQVCNIYGQGHWKSQNFRKYISLLSEWKNNKEINIWQEDEGMLNVLQYSDFRSTFENLNM
jgi:hypothetical protein